MHNAAGEGGFEGAAKPHDYPIHMGALPQWVRNATVTMP